MKSRVKLIFGHLELFLAIGDCCLHLLYGSFEFTMQLVGSLLLRFGFTLECINFLAYIFRLYLCQLRQLSVLVVQVIQVSPEFLFVSQ
jgi:hypothetical protein